MSEKPNILVILTDQQSAYMMSCAGNNSLRTPAIDRLAASGIRFDRAYCTNPVCVPSRFSLQTGQMPSAIGMKWNDELPVREEIVKQSLGVLFNEAGYDTVYAGKVHLPGVLAKPEDNGYTLLTPDGRQGLADACFSFLEGPREKPFMLFASFINPHDICYMAINDALRAAGKAPHDNIDSTTCEMIADQVRDRMTEAEDILPPLPDNFSISESEPDAISTNYLTHQYLGVAFRRHAREEWGETEWRIYRQVYRKLTEMVDSQIGQVLNALLRVGIE
jgi:arylsulfatase A-like enzyme